jgi:hypothetical protein
LTVSVDVGTLPSRTAKCCRMCLDLPSRSTR